MGRHLNLGCGRKPLPGAVNVDRVPQPGVDVVCDLDEEPWPWPDGSVDRIDAVHVFEHVHNPVGFMCEAWRVLVPGGALHIEVPHWQSRNAFTDPTHVRFCTEDTFRYWVPDTWLSWLGGDAYHRGRCLFDEQANTVVDGDLVVDLAKR